MNKSELVTSLSRIEFWRDFFAVIVAIGIVGEVLFGLKYTSRSKALHVIEERKEKELNLQIETLRSKNLELESAISPRRFDDQGAAADRLKSFAGITVAIMFSPDLECQRTAEQIAFVLGEAKWNCKWAKSREAAIFSDGVTVGVNMTSYPANQEESNLFDRSQQASEALVVELNKTKIKATKRPMDDTQAPAGLGVVVVQVGFKPSPLNE